MRAKRMFMATMAAMFVMTGAFQTESFASNGNGGTRLVAKLELAPPVDDFKGRAVQRVHGGRTVFKAQVEVPLSVLKVDPADPEAAEKAESVSVKLTVPGKMDCTMKFDEVDLIEGVAEYKLFVRQRNTVPPVKTIKAGLCSSSDISFISPGDQVSVTIDGVDAKLNGNFLPKQ